MQRYGPTPQRLTLQLLTNAVLEREIGQQLTVTYIEQEYDKVLLLWFTNTEHESLVPRGADRSHWSS